MSLLFCKGVFHMMNDVLYVKDSKPNYLFRALDLSFIPTSN